MSATPKPAVPEQGSKKMINGVGEVVTRHVFTTERGVVWEKTNGEYILPNGERVNDRPLLELLPEGQKQKALAWWEKNFGNGGSGVGELVSTGDDTIGRVMAENEALKAQIAALTAKPKPDPEPEEQMKDVKEVKRLPGRPKSDKGSEVLRSMGIGA